MKQGKIATHLFMNDWEALDGYEHRRKTNPKTIYAADLTKAFNAENRRHLSEDEVVSAHALGFIHSRVREDIEPTLHAEIARAMANFPGWQLVVTDQQAQLITALAAGFSFVEIVRRQLVTGRSGPIGTERRLRLTPRLDRAAGDTPPWKRRLKFGVLAAVAVRVPRQVPSGDAGPRRHNSGDQRDVHACPEGYVVREDLHNETHVGDEVLRAQDNYNHGSDAPLLGPRE